jgi:hypothetical protein
MRPVMVAIRLLLVFLRCCAFAIVTSMF